MSTSSKKPQASSAPARSDNEQPKPEEGVREISNDNCCRMFWHCRRCLEELPAGESPASYARLSVGSTPMGIQVWCERHDINVLHMDFNGQKFRANLSAKDDVKPLQLH